MPTHSVAVIVGSLRKESFSKKLANALARLAPASLKLDVITLEGVSSFNQNPDQPDLVSVLPKSTGRVVKGVNGVRYFTGLHQVDDPSIARLTSQQQLNEYSSLFALADSSGKLVAVNPTPGKLGNMAYGYLQGPGYYRFDLNQNQLLTGLRFRPIRAEFIGSRIPRSSHGMRLSR